MPNYLIVFRAKTQQYKHEIKQSTSDPVNYNESRPRLTQELVDKYIRRTWPLKFKGSRMAEILVN